MSQVIKTKKNGKSKGTRVKKVQDINVTRASSESKKSVSNNAQKSGTKKKRK